MFDSRGLKRYIIISDLIMVLHIEKFLNYIITF